MSEVIVMVDILNEYKFVNVKMDEIKEKLIPPNNVGVYVLKNGEKYLYIGMSTNLRSRIPEHLTGGFSGEIDTAIVYITENNVYADILESYLIAKHIPKYNKAKIPEEVVSIIDIETELVELDEKIQVLLENKEELISEYSGTVFDETSCISFELTAINDEIESLRLSRRRLRELGANPLDNTSYFAISENNSMSRIYWRMKQKDLLDGERLYG